MISSVRAWRGVRKHPAALTGTEGRQTMLCMCATLSPLIIYQANNKMIKRFPARLPGVQGIIKPRPDRGQGVACYLSRAKSSRISRLI